MSVTIAKVLDIAAQSPCIRRKYGAVITWNDGIIVATGYNERVSSCCEETCIRDELQIEHGRNTDAGAEIHAEQAALINLTSYGASRIYVAGLGRDGQPMNGFDNAPCYSCARMIAYEGIEQVFIPVDGKWDEININDVLYTWERKWN